MVNSGTYNADIVSNALENPGGNDTASVCSNRQSDVASDCNKSDTEQPEPKTSTVMKMSDWVKRAEEFLAVSLVQFNIIPVLQY